MPRHELAASVSRTILFWATSVNLFRVLELEKLCDLYFELSNEARMQILQTLIEGPIKLTMLSNRLDISSTRSAAGTCRG